MKAQKYSQALQRYAQDVESRLEGLIRGDTSETFAYNWHTMHVERGVAQALQAEREQLEALELTDAIILERKYGRTD